MSETLRTKIEENAQKPQRASNDAGSVEQFDLVDQIKADEYLSSIEAVKRNRLNFTKMSPPGTV